MDQNNNNNNQNNLPGKTLKDAIVEKIKQGDVKMRSRAYFAWQMAAVVASVALILLFAVSISSFLVFTLRSSGRILLPGFGWQGWRIFLIRFPWATLSALIGLVAILEILVKRFSYRRPVVYLLAAILAAIAFVGVLLDRTPLNDFLFEQAQHNRLPVAGHFYRQFDRERVEEIHRGVITGINQNRLALKTEDNELDIVIPNPDVAVNNLRVGDEVFVLGTEANNEIRAFGIRKVGPNPPVKRNPRPNRMMNRSH